MKSSTLIAQILDVRLPYTVHHGPPLWMKDCMSNLLGAQKKEPPMIIRAVIYDMRETSTC